MILKPDYNLESISDINIKELKQKNIKLLVFDLDSTVMASKSAIFEQWVLDLLDKLKQEFQVIILSNNKDKKYIEKIQPQCDIEIIYNANKPFSKPLTNYLHKHSILPEHTAIIGDRPLTDVLAGKFYGCMTILVDSITKNTESKPVQFVRQLERIFIRK